jgi:hypothetical protein
MLSGSFATMSTEMTGVPLDPAQVERALDRLAEHCELTARRQSRLEERRVAVQARLEHELGTDLARTLLRGLAFAPAA